MSERIKIAYIAKDMPINGISTVIMNYCRNIERNKFKITVFAGEPIDKAYENECESMGISIVRLSAKRGSPFNYYLKLWKCLTKEKFDIVHIHGNSATITIELMMAFLNGIKVRVAHCHNSTCTSKKAHKLLQPLFKRLYTHGFACSNLAGKWLFEECNFEVLPNGFVCEKFKFDEAIRNKVRSELSLEDKFVIGHVGMFNEQKNHPFILKVFERVAEIRPDAYLLLVGHGPDYDKIQDLIGAHPYKERIICYGNTTEVENLYNAMDVFLFPSKFEGLGIVLLEAQINGLYCVASDAVPKEVNICDAVEFVSLNEDVLEWSNKIIEKEGRNERVADGAYDDNIMRYDIKKCSKALENSYSCMIKGK